MTKGETMTNTEIVYYLLSSKFIMAVRGVLPRSNHPCMWPRDQGVNVAWISKRFSVSVNTPMHSGARHLTTDRQAQVMIDRKEKYPRCACAHFVLVRTYACSHFVQVLHQEVG